jgi:hypothetical protein
MDSERKKLRESVLAREDEVRAVKEEFERYQNNPAPDGRVETIWAAFNYLVGKADGAMERLEGQISRQAKELEANFTELQKREQRIKELESRGDTLSLLYWTAIQMASKGALAGGAIEPPETGKNPDNGEAGSAGSFPGGNFSEGNSSSGGAGGPGARVKGELPENPKTEESLGLSALIIRSVRRAAKKTLFSILITGGLVLFSPPAGADEPVPPGHKLYGDYRPEYGNTASFQKFRDYPRNQGRITVIQTRMPSKTLRRTVDLGFLKPDERGISDSFAEEKCESLLRNQAEALGLDLEEWTALVRTAFPKEETVYLNDLENPSIFPKLLFPKLPKLSEAIKNDPGIIFEGSLWTMALKNIMEMRSPEGLFWDRVYLEFAKLLGDNGKGAESALLRISRKRSLSLPRMEFGGSLTPLKDLEELPHDKAVSFLAGHIRNWKETSPRRVPKGTQPEWLATDIYNASRIFRVPFTYLSVLYHQHFDSGGLWPTALDVYTAGRSVVTLISLVSRTWSETKAPICDLEETVRYFPVSERQPQVFTRKYSSLINAFRAAYSSKKLFLPF